MKTLIKTDENGFITKSFYTSERSAQDAAGSFLNDCTIHAIERAKRKVEIIDFEYSKYGFDRMPKYARYEQNNLGLYVHGVFTCLNGRNHFRTSHKVNHL